MAQRDEISDASAVGQAFGPRASDVAHEILPRERLYAAGAAALAADELLALLLGTGARSVHVSELARVLLARAGGLRGLAHRTLDEWIAERGVGPARAARLVAAFELARRLAQEPRPRGLAIRSGHDVVRILGGRLRDQSKESFVALLLDGKHRLVREEMVSQGSLTASIVHPREVFRAAIREGAAALVVAHNHPSGDPSPSREDIDITARLVEAGQLVGIPLLDHVVLGDGNFVSLRERGLIGAR